MSAVAPVTYQNIGQNANGFLICPGNVNEFNVYNGDIANVLLVSQSTAPGLTNSIPVQPLTNATVSGGQGAWYASAETGTVATITVSSSAQISPSPAQIATQISLLGLATSANQAAGITSVDGVNTTLGSPAQNSHVANPNPNFWGGSVGSWSSTDSTVAPANPVFPNCPNAYAAQLTPLGGSAFTDLNSDAFTVQPNTVYDINVAANIPSATANFTSAYVQYTWYNAANVQISQSKQSFATIPNAVWQRLTTIHAQFTSPATGASAVLTIGWNVSAGDVPATAVWQVAFALAIAELPAAPAQEATLAGLHDRIANTGSPLLVLPQIIESVSAVSLALNQTVSYGPFDINQPSYDGYLSYETSSAGPAVLQVEIFWYLNGNGPLVYENYFLYAGSTSEPHFVFFKGPTKGNQVTIEITALADAGEVGELIFLANSRIFPCDIWRTATNLLTFPGLTLPGTDPPSNTLIAESVSIAGGSTNTYVLPLWTGKISIQASTAAGNTDLQVTIINQAEQDTSALPVFNQFANAAGTITATDVYLPKAQCTVSLKNEAAGAETIDILIVACEY